MKRWIRNLVHETADGVSLPLTPGRFFPDFIAELKDGRFVIIEYKGGHLAQRPEELHKETVGIAIRRQVRIRSGGRSGLGGA